MYFCRCLLRCASAGNLRRKRYQFTMQDTDTNELYKWAPKVEEKLRTTPGLLDVTSDLRLSSPTVTVEIDRKRAPRTGSRSSRCRRRSTTHSRQRQVSTIDRRRIVPGDLGAGRNQSDPVR